MPQKSIPVRWWGVNAIDTSATALNTGFEDVFDAQFSIIARVIRRVIEDPSRAEELAVDVFLKWKQNPQVQGEQTIGWLCRTATHAAIDEWRRQRLRRRFEAVAGWFGRPAPNPEEELRGSRSALQVRKVLAGLKARDSEALLLWSEGFTYRDIASTIGCGESNVGSILNRAQTAFKKDYERRYGKEF